MIIEMLLLGLFGGAAAAAVKKSAPGGAGSDFQPSITPNANTAAGQALKAAILAPPPGQVRMPNGTLISDARVPTGMVTSPGMVKTPEGLKIDMKILPGAVSTPGVSLVVKAPTPFNPLAVTAGKVADLQQASAAAKAAVVPGAVATAAARTAERAYARAMGADYDDGT